MKIRPTTPEQYAKLLAEVRWGALDGVARCAGAFVAFGEAVQNLVDAFERLHRAANRDEGGGR